MRLQGCGQAWIYFHLYPEQLFIGGIEYRVIQFPTMAIPE